MLAAFVCIHECVCVHTYAEAHAHMLTRTRGQCLVSSFFTLVFEFLSQGLSANLDLADPSRLASQQAQESSCFYVLSAGTGGF